MYITEIAPLHVRGSFGACFQLFVAIAVLLAQLLGLDIYLGQKHLWNYLFGLLFSQFIYLQMKERVWVLSNGKKYLLSLLTLFKKVKQE